MNTHHIESLKTANAILTMVSYPDFEEGVLVYFHNNEKVFRLSDEGEFNYLASQGLEKVEVPQEIENKLSEQAIKLFPRYLGCLETVADYENYYWAKSNNGGCYAHYTTEHYFLLPSGEIALIEQRETGSEFRETFDGDNIPSFARVMDMRLAVDFVASGWCEINDEESYTGVIANSEDFFTIRFSKDAFMHYLGNLAVVEYTSKYDDDGICCQVSEEVMTRPDTKEIREALNAYLEG